MKLNMFRLRKNADHSEIQQAATPQSAKTQYDVHDSLKATHQNMDNLMSMFEAFLKISVEQQKAGTGVVHHSQTYSKTQMNYENRDRHVIVAVPSVAEVQPNQATLERWLTEVAMGAFSSSFNFYLSEQMSFQQAKVFCSETILANLLRYTEKYPLSQQQMELINDQFSNNILEYLQQKYPLTLNTDVNKALQKELHLTNNFDLLANDFLYCNGIIFSYREEENYNDIIMKVINKTLEIVDGVSKSPSEASDLTNYQDFQLYIRTLFQSLYKEDWMSVSKNIIKAENRNQAEQREKYAEKVKSYTNFAIGRKISENTPQFTPQEIASNNLQIRSPAILRILTKWCEQLWSKFQTNSYYSQRSEPILLEDPEFINPFFKWMKTAIDKEMALQKTKILQFKKNLDKHSNYQESLILIKYLQEDDVNFISKYEKAYGMFSSHMVKNLHSYIVLYLNRLIHGLLAVSKRFHTKNIDKSWEMWQSPPNLVTFKVGDLMRCKCSSKEKEIIKIYREINSLSSENPEKIKIVRVKNRLREGTNDILINVKFNDLIICQIQLEVNYKSKSKFIQCSNAFSHYIYELRRSIFGPITEISNIWNNFDARSKTFNRLLLSKQKKVNSTEALVVPDCQQEKHEFQPYNLPFQCTICNNLYFHNNYVIPNRFCQKCKTFKCVRCQIRLLNQTDLKQALFEGNQRNQVKSLSKIDSNKIPQTGACLKIESTTAKIELFRKIKVQSNDWLFGMNENNQIYEIAKINTGKEISQFFRQYFIFNLSLDPPKTIKVTPQQALYFSVKEYVKESYSKQKEQLILTQVKLTNAQWNILLKKEVGTEKDRKRIKKIQFASNYLKTCQFFALFQNLTQINLDYSFMADISCVLHWKKLQKLQLRQNSKLQAIGKEICELEYLQELKLNNCVIKTLPDDISRLKALQVLVLQKNRLSRVSTQVCQLKNLRNLNLRNNSIQQLPQRIGDLSALRTLNISKNSISDLPASVERLVNLVILNLSNNKIKQIPAALKNLQKLQKFEANCNQISELDQHIFEMQSLKTLSLMTNNFIKFNCNLSLCRNLQTLLLSNNQINELSPSIGDCSNLVNLQLDNNKLESLPDSLSSLQNLVHSVNLSKNKLSKWPKFVLQFSKLQELNLSQNQLTLIPAELCRLKMLDKLNLSSNKIASIPPQFKSSSQLIDFNFNNNAISIIPDFLHQFQCIKRYPHTILERFLSNSISQLPEFIFEKLGQQVIFTSNKLSSIPKGIKEKSKVRILNLQSNCILQIPSFITEFTNLAELNLRRNSIEVIPLYLSELKNIRPSCLFLNENPIRAIQCQQFISKYGHPATRALVNPIQKNTTSYLQQNDFSDQGF